MLWSEDNLQDTWSQKTWFAFAGCIKWCYRPHVSPGPWIWHLWGLGFVKVRVRGGSGWKLAAGVRVELSFTINSETITIQTLLVRFINSLWWLHYHIYFCYLLWWKIVSNEPTSWYKIPLTFGSAVLICARLKDGYFTQLLLVCFFKVINTRTSIKRSP